MRAFMLLCVTVLVAGCATTYGMPLAERSRTYRSTHDAVWSAVLEAADDMRLAAVESDYEHGLVRARAKSSFWDFKGHEVTIVVRNLGGRVRVDANATTVTSVSKVDFGRSKGLVRDYLAALDRRMEARGAGPR